MKGILSLTLMVFAGLVLPLPLTQEAFAEEAWSRPSGELLYQLRELERSFRHHAIIGTPYEKDGKTYIGWYQGQLDQIVRRRDELLKKHGCTLAGYWMTEGPFTRPRVDTNYQCPKAHPPE